MAQAMIDLRRLRPSYGIDAPGLVKGFFIGGTSSLILLVIVGLASWPSGIVGVLVMVLCAVASAYALGMGCYMLYGSLVSKVRDRHRLLDLLPWSGSEAVLDVGCGRGLLLVAAAGRVPSGRAVGVDIWQAVDQSGNRPEATIANARAEGVSDRVEVLTGDVRQLPFPDGTFDLVVSHWVVHNLYERLERARALAEMARVLKPGGWVLIADIEHHAEYVVCLKDLGFDGIRHVVSRFWDRIRTVITFGSFRPAVVIGQKQSDLAKQIDF